MTECPICGEGWTLEQRVGLERGPAYEALREMVEMWISEGFVSSYTPEQYEVFAWLGISGDVAGYDTTPEAALRALAAALSEPVEAGEPTTQEEN